MHCFPRTNRSGRNVLIFLVLVMLCLMAALVPRDITDRVNSILELDFIIPSSMPSPTFRQSIRRKSAVEAVNELKLNDILMENSNWTDTFNNSSEKYIIYLCDGTIRCYGLADRERGITLAYLMSLLTNRQFGIISTSPAPLEDYYVPNVIDWKIPWNMLEGKSSVEISLLGRRQQVGLSKIDFNKKYPQDIVYLRTNRDIGSIHFKNNPHYRFHFTVWNLKTFRKLFAKIWIILMKPSNPLRFQLNVILAEIAQTMAQEALLHSTLEKLPCKTTCELLKTNKKVWKEPDFKLFLYKKANKCITSLQNSIKDAPSDIYSGENKDTLLSLVNFNNDYDTEEELDPEVEVDLVTTLQEACAMKPAIATNISVDDIWASKEYDYLKLKLVCVHIRLGNSPTMPFEKAVRNTLEDTKGVWDFLRPYVNSGHHVFLASDSEQVRLKGKEKFGPKLHITKDPVIHIDKVKDGQDERKGMDLALTEQLLLMTSCHTLVVSHSGFSMRAALIRKELYGIDNVYYFGKSRVIPWTMNF